MFSKISLFFTKQIKSSMSPKVRHFHKGLKNALRIPSEMLCLMCGSYVTDKNDTRMFKPGNNLADCLYDGATKASRIELVFDGKLSATTASTNGLVDVKAHFYSTGQKKSQPFMTLDWICCANGEISGPGIIIRGDYSELLANSPK
jgi:hypothetical protein